MTPSAEIAPGVPPVPGDVLTYAGHWTTWSSTHSNSPRPRGHVVVRLFGGQDTVTLQVSDTGVGIPNDQLERIFERFYQVDGQHHPALWRHRVGTGAGQRDRKSARGQITVTSQVGLGTTFTGLATGW